MSGAPDRWWEADPIVPTAAAAAGDRWWEADPVVGRDAAIGDDPSAGWVTTAVSNLGRGAADVVAGIPKQLSIAQAQGNRQVLDIFDRIDASGLRASERRMQPESVGIGDVPVVTMGDIEAYERADDAGRAALRQKYAMTDPREGGGYRAGQWISDRVKAALPVNPEYAEDWLASKIPNALGSAVGFLGLGVAGRAMGMPWAAVAAGGGAAVGGAQQFEDAIAHGASIEDAFKAANLGALVGTSEAVPIGRLLDRLDKGTGGSIKRLIREAIKQGSEEAAQEAFQTISANLIASDLVAYDPERGTFQGAGEAAGVGFSVGALMQTIGGLVLPHGRRGNTAAGQQGAPSPAAVDAPRPQQQAAVAADLPAGALPAEDVIGAVEAPPPRMAPITEEDRESPLPDASISRGKAIIDDALAGRPLDIAQPEPTAEETATEQLPALPPAEREVGATAIASAPLVDSRGLVPTAVSGSQAAPPVTATAGAAPGPVAANDTMPAAAAAPETPAAKSGPRASIPHRPLDQDVAVTSGGREVPVRYAIVEAGDLVASQTDDGRSNPAYPQEMQPRDRSRATSQTQINDIAQRLNPRLLDRSARASDGAPIIADDGVVESGNGRVLAIRRAYAQGGAERYREHLVAQGYPVEGMRAPVLVRIRGGDMSPAERMAFTREANERDTLGMSTTERAMADAAAMPDDLLTLYRGGDIDAAGNRDFVRRFIQSVVARNDQAGMIAADGAMSQEAVRRIEAALLARAYGDAALVAELVESADTNIRAIGGALIDLAGVWAGMRADAAAKRIAPEMDQTDALLEAVRLVQRARREGRSLTLIVEQTDILSGRSISPIGELFLRLFYRNTILWTQPAGRERVAFALRVYTTEAGKTRPGLDLLGQTAVSPNDILRVAKEKQYEEDDAPARADLLAKPAGSAGDGARKDGRERTERAEPDGLPAGGGEGARAGGEGAGAGVASAASTPAGDTDKPSFTRTATTTDAFRRTGGPGAGQDGAQRPDAAIELAPDVEARLSADPVMAARLARAKAEIEKAVRRIAGPDVQIEVGLFEEVMERQGQSLIPVRGALIPVPGRPYQRFLALALKAGDEAYADSEVLATARHELLHVARRTGMISEKAWRSLDARARAVWIERYQIKARYPDLPLDMQIEEAVADAYGEWSLGRLEETGIIARTFRALRDFLADVLKQFRGRLLKPEQIVEEIFRDLERGRLALSAATPSRRPFESAREADAWARQGEGEDATVFERTGIPLSKEQEQDAEGAGAGSDGGAAARRSLMMRLIESQPLDRVMRIPFDVFGGLDRRGRWQPGLWLSDQAKRVITQAEFRDDGRMAWMNGFLHKARAALVDRYGLDPAYVERDRKRALDERRIQAQIPELMATFRDAGIGLAEAKVLQAVLTGETVPDADMAKLSEPVRNAIDSMGREAVDLGLLSAEAYERNRGAYLHRVYLKHETDQNSLVRWVARLAGARRKKIVGDQFKGRGMWIEAAPAAVGDLTAASGDRFQVLDRIEDGKVRQRVYLPDGAEVPERYEGFVDRGVWEVRGRKGGKLVLWRDFTKAERERMGEIVDARYTIAKTYMAMAHDLATGRFYKDIAENPEWSTEEPPEGAGWKEAADYSRFWADPDVQWVKVPDTTIEKSSTKRYGALAGRFVRAEIWRDIQEIERMQQPIWWDSLMRQFKLNHTARAPVVHMNNVMSNAVLMDLADVRAVDLARGIRSLVRGDADYQAAVEAGAFGTDMMSIEIRKNTLEPLLQEIERDMQGGKGGMEATAGLLGKVLDAIWSGLKRADTAMLDLYRLEDEVFRMATYLRRRSQGYSVEQAAREAREQFLDYDIRAPLINAARRTVLPFLSYTYRAVPVIAKSVAVRPWKLAKYALVAYVLDELAYMITGDGDDEERQRRSMREQDQGYTWIGAPRMWRMPWSDDAGNPVFLDVRRWIPAGDVFDTNQGSSALPMPSWLQFGGPLMLASELMLNKSGFTGQRIVNEYTDTLGDKAGKVGNYLWKAWMPSAAWIPGSWYWSKIGDAITGVRDWRDRPYSVPQALASSVGIKIKPHSVDDGFYFHGREFDRIERELRAQARSLDRERARGRISEAEYGRQILRLVERQTELAQRRSRTLEGTAVPP